MARLSIRLLGQFLVALDGKSITGFSTNKARALLAYLAVEADRAHHRQALAGLLWPDFPEQSARTSLRSALANLRLVLKDRETEQPFLHITRQAIQFNTGSDTWVDASALTKLLSTNTSSPLPIHQLEEAVAVYQGDFLEGFSLADNVAFEEWALIIREQLKRQTLATLHQLSAHYEEQGDYQKALVFTRRQVALDTWQEPAQRQFLQLLAFSGQRATALTQYEAFRNLLVKELDVEPSKETRILYEQIRDEKLISSTTSAIPHNLLAQPPSFLSEAEEVESRKATFVARQNELTQLDSHLNKALSGQGRVVFISGDTGRGKTALIEEFKRRALNAHPNLLITEGICNAQSGIGDPYLPFRQALEMLTGAVESQWRAGRITTQHARTLWAHFPYTAALITTKGPDLINAFVAGDPLVRRVAAAVPSGTEWLSKLERHVEIRTAMLDAVELHQTDLFEQYTLVLQGLAQQVPLVLLLDDLQWADYGSIGLLFHLGRQISQSRILLVCAYRPEELIQGYSSANAEYEQQTPHPLLSLVNELQREYGEIIVDLDHEDPAQSQHFVEAYLDSEPNHLGSTFRQTLYTHTGGHPLFTIEFLRMLQERGDLVKDQQGHWVVSSSLAWDKLTPRIEAVIKQRLQLLGKNLREALSIASVEGETFTAQVVSRVQGIPERQWLRTLSQALEGQHHLVHEQGEVVGVHKQLSRYQFAHNLFQRYLYNEISAGERRLLHTEVAQALEELYTNDTEMATVELAYHYSQAASPKKALYYLAQAGQQAQARYASQEAIQYYTDALSLVSGDEKDCFDLLTARSAVYGLMADRERQLADIYTMLALAEGLGDRHRQCEGLIALGDYYLATEPFLARDPLMQAGTIAQSLGESVLEAHVLRRLAWAGRLGADFKTSRTYIDKAVTRFKKAALPGEAAKCLLMLARRLVGSGEHFAELDAAEVALSLSQQAGDLRQEAIARRQLAIAHLNHGRYHEALQLVEQALALHQELGDRSEECNSLDVKGVVLAWLGKSKNAEKQFRQCLRLAEEIGSDWGLLGVAFGYWNYWYLPRGEYEQLLSFSDQLFHTAQAHGHEWLIGFSTWMKSEALTDLGQFEEALEFLKDGLEGALIQGDLVSQALVRAEHGRIMGELGDYDSAWKNLDEALELVETTGDPYLASWPLINQAHLTLLEGKPANWHDGLVKAQQAAAACREVYEVRQLAEALNASARIYLAQGEPNLALTSSSEVIHLLDTVPALPMPQEYYYTHSQILQVIEQETEANSYLMSAYQRVMQVAEKLTDQELQQSWLKRRVINREIVTEAQSRGMTN